LWNVPAVGRVEFAENATRWQAGQAREIDYWLTAAPTPAGILARYADVTGHAPELPAWASGFWQSKLRYRTQAELLAVAREYQRRGLPLAVIVADFFHWSAMGDYRFDQSEWPDPDAMVAELRAMGTELMVSIWPTVSPLSENYGEYRDQGLLVGADQGVEFQQTIADKGMAAPMPVAFYDPTNPRTRDFVWDLVKRNYLDRGIRVFWLDASEPELNPAHPANLSLYAGPGAEVAGIYPRDNARLFADGMAAAGQEQTVFLSRSAWAGSQRFGAAVWSGDIPATWDALRRQVRAGLSIAVSGIPWWTTDIGGFHGGDPGDPAYQELIVRWFQYGAFCPLFRLHGDRHPRVPTGHAMTGGPNEVWSYGPAYDRIAAVLRLRERLRPYIHQQMRVASRDGVPPMRPLWVDFAQDPGAWRTEDAFMFGPDLLIAPVLEPGAVAREVYLPAGRAWVEAATGESRPGGATARVPLSPDRIPVFVTEGAEVLDVVR
jgi:alpha-D-xyloside xylohydrolase